MVAIPGVCRRKLLKTRKKRLKKYRFRCMFMIQEYNSNFNKES